MQWPLRNGAFVAPDGPMSGYRITGTGRCCPPADSGQCRAPSPAMKSRRRISASGELRRAYSDPGGIGTDAQSPSTLALGLRRPGCRDRGRSRRRKRTRSTGWSAMAPSASLGGLLRRAGRELRPAGKDVWEGVRAAGNRPRSGAGRLGLQCDRDLSRLDRPSNELRSPP
jgi:hypothetical protein